MTRRFWVIIAGGVSLTLLSSSVLSLPEKLIWNRTNSAPIGLYWLGDGPLTLNRWAVVSARSKAAIWASAHGFTGPNWLLLKRIRGLPGDEICRESQTIMINQIPVAEALLEAQGGLELPRWQGCHVLQKGEVFLLNDHPRSLDGRYFGVMKDSDLDGAALLLWEQQ